MPFGSSNGPGGFGRNPGYGGGSGPGNNQGVTEPGVSPGYGLGAATLPAGAPMGGSLMRPAVGNSCYVQCGKEVKKVNLPIGDGKCCCISLLLFL